MSAGALPKHKDEKVNRNIPAVPPQTLPMIHDLDVPKLSTNFKWTSKGRAYWKRLWQSPMAITYIDADIPGLERMTILTEVILTGDGITQGILSELRQLEDRFGLSPLARRRLQWDIDKEMERRTKPVDEAEPKDDDRFLRVVN